MTNNKHEKEEYSRPPYIMFGIMIMSFVIFTTLSYSTYNFFTDINAFSERNKQKIQAAINEFPNLPIIGVIESYESKVWKRPKCYRSCFLDVTEITITNNAKKLVYGHVEPLIGSNYKLHNSEADNFGCFETKESIECHLEHKLTPTQ